ncbi:hypothetical protein [Nostoc sp. C052]|nr:hypothetical protein [Nostoc sp. C052]
MTEVLYLENNQSVGWYTCKHLSHQIELAALEGNASGFVLLSLIVREN